MDDWRETVNWSEYHPSAKSILDDPFYWEEGNDYAPHGSDDGWDVFSAFRRWRAGNVNEDSKQFLNALLDGWGINAYRQDSEDTMMDQMRDAAQISLAFAHLKVDGACPQWACESALASIDRRYKFSTQDERKRTLNLMKSKLESLQS